MNASHQAHRCLDGIYVWPRPTNSDRVSNPDPRTTFDSVGIEHMVVHWV